MPFGHVFDGHFPLIIDILFTYFILLVGIFRPLSPVLLSCCKFKIYNMTLLRPIIKIMK